MEMEDPGQNSSKHSSRVLAWDLILHRTVLSKKFSFAEVMWYFLCELVFLNRIQILKSVATIVLRHNSYTTEYTPRRQFCGLGWINSRAIQTSPQSVLEDFLILWRNPEP